MKQEFQRSNESLIPNDKNNNLISTYKINKIVNIYTQFEL